MTAELNIRIANHLTANHLIANHLTANHSQTVVRPCPVIPPDCDFLDIVCRVTANHNQTLVRR